MIRITVTSEAGTTTGEISTLNAPALRAALDEISTRVAGRLENGRPRPQEQALTEAAVGLGQLRAALFPHVPEPDPRYVAR